MSDKPDELRGCICGRPKISPGAVICSELSTRNRADRAAACLCFLMVSFASRQQNKQKIQNNLLLFVIRYDIITVYLPCGKMQSAL